MNERIHRVLDGDLPREALSPEESAELETFEAAVAESDRLFAVAAPDLAPEIMERIAAAERKAERPSPLARMLDWLWRPRAVSFTLRPAPALAAAAAVAALVSLPFIADGRSRVAPTGAAAAESAEPRVYVHFRLDAPGASRVELAGDFTEWEPAHELYESRPGVWSVVIPLDPGVHDYAFVIDGERWMPDPLGVPVDDGFGGTNSRLSVLPPETARAS